MWNQPRKDRPSNFLRCATPTCRSVQKGSALHIVEQRIIDGLSELVEDIEIQSEAKDLSQESDVPYKRILVGKKEKELSELSAQKSHLHDLLERRTYDIETFMERQQNLTERINGLQDEIRNLESEIQKEESRKSNDDEFLPQLRFVLKAYQETTSAERKNVLLKSVLEKVTYLRKKEWVKQEEFELDLFTKINR
jgi:hypothetical protein